MLSITVPEPTFDDFNSFDSRSPQPTSVNGASIPAVNSDDEVVHLLDMQTYADLQDELLKHLKDSNYFSFAKSIPLLWFMTSIDDMEAYISNFLFYFVVFGCERPSHAFISEAILKQQPPISEIVQCFAGRLTAQQHRTFKNNLQALCEYVHNT
jgi:hypothetical protein|eukprot:6156-Heterococcus_DN1.PRE.13